MRRAGILKTAPQIPVLQPSQQGLLRRAISPGFSRSLVWLVPKPAEKQMTLGLDSISFNIISTIHFLLSFPCPLSLGSVSCNLIFVSPSAFSLAIPYLKFYVYSLEPSKTTT